jgi:hypothetical protein
MIVVIAVVILAATGLFAGVVAMLRHREIEKEFGRLADFY